MDRPKATVVITTYYRNRYLYEAISSVENQSIGPLEVLVVDCSRDGYAAPVIDAFDGVRGMVQEEDLGPHDARELGAKEARGDWIQFLDDDDRLKPNKIERQTEFAQQHGCGVVYGGIEYETGEEMLPEKRCGDDVLAEALGFGLHCCQTSSMLISRRVVNDVMPFRNHHGADDIGFRIELAKRTRFCAIDEPMIVAGIPEDSRGLDWQSIQGRWEILRSYEDLYAQYDPSVKRRALSELYQREGRRHLEQKVWSPEAILAFGRSLYYAPKKTELHIGEFVSSFFGRPGRNFAATIRRIVNR